MPGQAFRIKQFDTLPSIRGTLTYPTGDPYPLGTVIASAVLFHMRPSGVASAVIASAAVAILDRTTSEVEYSWATSGQTATPGVYQGEFVVVRADGKTQTTDGYLPITVLGQVS